ncbi:hypothetical protein CKA32_004598 [Geitlerinema sp. FC II]|nr:hypothetical protein CKA32_004598 [Geitlerinema sp. FC II]
MKHFLTLAFLAFGGISAGYAAEPEPAEIVPPTVTQYIPANAATVVLFRTDNTWSDLAQFAGVPDNIDAPGVLPFVPLANEDFDANVRSWAGEWAAFTTSTVSAISPEVPTYDITLLPLKDEDAFDRYLDRVRDSRSQPPEIQTHNGVEFLFFPADNPPPPPVLEEVPGNEERLDPASESSLTKAIAVYSNYFGDFKRSLLAQTAPSTPPETPTDDIPTVPFPPTPLYAPSLAIARLPGYVVFAATAEDLRGFLDVPSTVKPLAEVPGFQNLLAHEAFDRSLIAFYGNFKQIAQQLNRLPIPTGEGETFANLAEIYSQTYTTGEALVWTSDTGVRGQLRVHYREPQPDIAANATNDNRLLEYLPATVYGSVNGKNLGGGLRLILEAYSQIPELAGFVEQLRRGVEENLELDFDRDVLSWMDGEFALVAFPSNGGLFPSFSPEFQVGVGILLETSDRPAAERFLSTLDDFVGRVGEGLVSVDTANIAGEPFVSWNAPFSFDGSPVSQMSHGWLDDNTLLIATGTVPASQLYPQPRLGLVDSYNFQTAIAPFPTTNSGYLYYNFGSAWAFVNTLFLNSFPPPPPSANMNTFVDTMRSIRSFSFSVAFAEDREQADFNLVLSPKR